MRTTGCPSGVCPNPGLAVSVPNVTRHALARLLPPSPFACVRCGDVAQTSSAIQTIRQVSKLQWNLVPAVWEAALFVRLVMQMVCSNTGQGAVYRMCLLISVLDGSWVVVAVVVVVMVLTGQPDHEFQAAAVVAVD